MKDLAKKALLVLPNQLYEAKIPKDIGCVVILEEPIYFYDSQYHPYKPSKIKLAYLRACMRAYYDSIKMPMQKIYLSYSDLKSKTSYQRILGDLARQYILYAYDPTDHNVIRKWKDYGIFVYLLESPNFILTRAQLEMYHAAHPKSSRHASFYYYVKSILQLSVLDGIPNLDKENRVGASKYNINILNKKVKRNQSRYYDEACEYVNKHFSDHLSSTEHVRIYPITSAQAYKAFKEFLSERFAGFGPFQDIVITSEVVLNHSFISAAMNVGLMEPRKIVDMTVKYFKKIKSSEGGDGVVPLNSLEGFLRQVIGWREYMRYLYVFKYDDMMGSIENVKKYVRLADMPQLYGKTGIVPFDKEVEKVMNFGYAHHIVRLMIFLNIFILYNIHPEDIYRWFTEIVCIDAYHWVMIPNIYAMGYFYKGATSKRYISSSNYIRKMTDYKHGPWCDKWDALYRKYKK